MPNIDRSFPQSDGSMDIVTWAASTDGIIGTQARQVTIQTHDHYGNDSQQCWYSLCHGNGRQQSWFCMLDNDHARYDMLSLSALTPML